MTDKPTPSTTVTATACRDAAPRPHDATLAALEVRYEIAALVGSGGMGKVYRARDRETNETVAIKVLLPDIAHDPAMAERFKNELRLARRITHKNVCRIYDFNRIGDVAFITMEFVDGESLRAYLRRCAPLAVDVARNLLQQIIDGLREAHAQGVVHRDLKPENIMLARGAVKIMDFGIARSLHAQATTTSAFLGTPAYIAPEQAQGKPIDQRADVYALGLIFYECLTGRAAFSGDTPIEVALKQVNERPLAPRRIVAAVPAHVEAIIMRCLEKDPEKRYASVEQLSQALAAGASSAPRIAEPRASVAAPRRRRWPWVGAAALIAAAIAYQQRPAPTPIVSATPPKQMPMLTPPPVATTTPDAIPTGPERATLHQQLLAAAEAGEPQAQYRLALAMTAGPVAIRDEQKAAQWMQRAAESNYVEAQFALGKIYERGRGVPQDIVIARHWYERAAAAGHAQARSALQRSHARPRTRP